MGFNKVKTFEFFIWLLYNFKVLLFNLLPIIRSWVESQVSELFLLVWYHLASFSWAIDLEWALES